MELDHQAEALKSGARAESLDALHAALRAADEIAAALQAHLTQEHGAHIEDRSHAVAPTLDLLRHARERIAAGLKDIKEPGTRSGRLRWPGPCGHRAGRE